MTNLRILAENLSKYPKIKKTLKDLYQYAGNLLSDKKSQPLNIEQVSSSRNEHLFGYYDKSPWNASGTKMVYLGVNKASKFDTSSTKANIILKDLLTNEELIISETNSWNVQQGCMLQWLGPDFDSKIIFNDFRNNKNCAVIYDLNTGDERILQAPVYSVSNCGDVAITLDFKRLNSFRPGYGYNNDIDMSAKQKIPDSACLWNLNIKTNKLKSIMTYNDLTKDFKENMDGSYHKVNHIMINPSGNRFMFLHRWIKEGVKYDRLITCNMFGEEKYILLDDDMVSHSNWKNDDEIISWAKTKKDGSHYYLLEDQTDKVRLFNEKQWTVDGHPSYSPNKEWIVTDTYPNFKRKQQILLYNNRTQKNYQLATVYSNIKYKNETRCDLHPRWNREGTKICFDGAMGSKRQVYIIEIPDNKY